MKNYFKPKDFQLDEARGNTSVLLNASAALMANEKLNALIESWPVVYGMGNNPYWYKQNYLSNDRREIATHKARLAFIEEIAKEPCKHEPSPIDSFNGAFVSLKSTICKHCGVELQATWSAKESK